MISSLGIRSVAQERAAGPSGLFPCQQSPYPPALTPKVFPRSDMILFTAMLYIIVILCINMKQNL